MCGGHRKGAGSFKATRAKVPLAASRFSTRQKPQCNTGRGAAKNTATAGSGLLQGHIGKGTSPLIRVIDTSHAGKGATATEMGQLQSHAGKDAMADMSQLQSSAGKGMAASYTGEL